MPPFGCRLRRVVVVGVQDMHRADRADMRRHLVLVEGRILLVVAAVVEVDVQAGEREDREAGDEDDEPDQAAALSGCAPAKNATSSDRICCGVVADAITGP